MNDCVECTSKCFTDGMRMLVCFAPSSPIHHLFMWTQAIHHLSCLVFLVRDEACNCSQEMPLDKEPHSYENKKTSTRELQMLVVT